MSEDNIVYFRNATGGERGPGDGKIGNREALEIKIIDHPVTAQWAPKSDITAYELALCLPYFMPGAVLTEQAWESLGDAQRHFVRWG